jgi:hypothetical protein
LGQTAADTTIHGNGDTHDIDIGRSDRRARHVLFYFNTVMAVMAASDAVTSLS